MQLPQLRIACAATCLLTLPLVRATAQRVASAPEAEQQIVCNSGYTIERCREQAAVLRAVLRQFRAERLGPWTWVLVRSEDWKTISRRRGLDPDSPAFSYLPGQQTFLEEALVGAVPGRRERLLAHWSESPTSLLLLAVTHELGHALCQERDESEADRNGQRLRRGQDVICRGGLRGNAPF